MLSSHDANGSIPMDMCFLGVVDLNLFLSPDAFGLRAFDHKQPLTRMLPGSNPCELRLMLPDSQLEPTGSMMSLLITWPLRQLGGRVTFRRQQHLLIFQAIVKSNGWSPMTAALQLFAHLDGEALNVAMLMPVEEREQWKDLANGLSEYYNSPGRLAVVRRRFESASRRPGVDPATFATELGILAVRGFENMGERARDLMIQNKFIAAQQSCELRRHLDGASADASIRDIVDSCRVIPRPGIVGMVDQTRNFHRKFPRWRRTPTHKWRRQNRRRYTKT